jgi:hypothetical protein
MGVERIAFVTSWGPLIFFLRFLYMIVLHLSSYVDIVKLPCVANVTSRQIHHLLLATLRSHDLVPLYP